MSVSKIIIPNASAFSRLGFFGKIAPYQLGAVKLSDLPKSVIIRDPETKEEFNSNLVSVVGFDFHVVPDILSRMFEGKPAEESTKEILARCKVQNINQLGFYLYEYQR